MLKKILFFFSILVISNSSLACKERKEVAKYSLDELQKSEILVEAKVTNMKASDHSWYLATESFKATIMQSFKGDLVVGQVINVVAAKEEAHAVCPVNLEEGKTYMLVLNVHEQSFEISRFNIAISNENKNYKRYIQQIAASSN